MEVTRTSRTLLLFCKFLAHRVRTENLDLLYNIAVDFLNDPPCLTRVDEMIYRIFPLVAIVPTEITNPSARAKADKLLQRVSEQSGDLSDEDELHELGMALHERVMLKNWDVLEQMYADFKVGRDQILRAFVALQPQAIAIIPIVPPKPGITFSAGQNDNCNVESAAKPDQGIPETRDRELRFSLGKPFKNFTKDTPPEIHEMTRIIRVELDAIEATKPWNRVYDVSEIVYPFDATKHPALAERFKRFWTRYARAVWQRRFWCRVPTVQRDALQDADTNAVRSFQSLVFHPLFQAFGAAFFVKLDSRSSQLHWWWYREPLVDLLMMASVEGIKYCKRYMRSQCNVAHPTPHPQFQVKTSYRVSPSLSMWSTNKHTSTILDAIIALKEQLSQAPQKRMTGRKRTRTVSSDSDEDQDE